MQKRLGAMQSIWVLAACLAVAAANLKPINNVAKPLKVNALQRDDSDYRLDGKILPSNYVIKITPKFVEDKTETFSGEVKIAATVNEATDKIVLHCASNIEKLSEVNVCLKSSDGSCVNVPLNTEDPHNAIGDLQFLNINLQTSLEKDGEIIITINYEAFYPEGMYGFYKSTYAFEVDGVEREDVLLTTQFQPTHAREAFPCFDEPAYKASFDITLVVPEGYGGLSNAEAIDTGTSTKDGKAEGRVITFKTTPIMSTYLVAFIVYKEESFKSTDYASGDLPFRTWGRANGIDSGFGDLSQVDGPGAITKMEEFTEVLYSTYAKKIDQAAIPDFSAGAMENWGLITYRETAVLYDSSEHTQAAKERAATVIAHELAHQWFGNLVTTKWWDSTWLNEGFATYFEYYIPSLLHPDWRLMERLVTEEQLAAFSADETSSAGSLTKDVYTPDQITNHFSTITYSKGGSILRMFSNIIGEEKFRSALNSYLTENALGSVTPDILISTLTRDAGDVGLPEGSDLAEILKSWTETPGFPLITVRHGHGDIILEQTRFLSDETTSSNVYKIHLTLKSNDENYEDKKIWLLEQETSIAEVPDTEKWLLVPTDGYFRVNYDEQNWALLTEELRESSKNELEAAINPLERSILIDSALNLARIDTLPYSVAIQLLSYLENELDFLPWSVALSGLNYIHRMLWNEGDTMDRFMLKIIDNVYEDLGSKLSTSTEDKHVEHLHRANVFSWACRIGHQNCINSAVDHLTQYLDGEEEVKVLPNLRSIVYCYGVKNDERLWPKLWKKLDKTDDAAERALIISALGCAPNINTLYMYLQNAVLDGGVRIQDIASVFSAVNANLEGADAALEFLDYKLSEIEERTSTVMNGMSSILRGTARYLKTEDHKNQFEKISNAISNDVDKETAQNALVSVGSNLEWLQQKDEIIAELEKVLDDEEDPTQEPTGEPTGDPTTESPGESTTQGALAHRPATLLLSLLATLPALALLL